MRGTKRSFAQWLSSDVRIIIWTRALRTFGYGFTSILLGILLEQYGISSLQIGLLLAIGAIGSIACSILLGFYADRLGRRRLLILCSLLMMGTGCLFACTQSYPLLIAAAFFGTISPSTNDNTPFSGIEQAILAQMSPNSQHTALFARYNMAAQLAGALGGLLVGLPNLLPNNLTLLSERGLFLLYALLAGGTGVLFARLSSAVELTTPCIQCSRQRLQTRGRTRMIVFKLSALFAIDAFAGSLAAQTVLALWFSQRFSVSLASLGLLFFCVNLLAALSLLSARFLSKRMGLLRTMIVPHTLANLLLLLVACMPTFPLAASCLLLRQSLSKIDVPARQTFTAALVPLEDRTAIASFTTVARSIAVALGPLVAGLLLSSALPLFLASWIGLGYDGTLWGVFHDTPLYVYEHAPDSLSEPREDVSA